MTGAPLARRKAGRGVRKIRRIFDGKESGAEHEGADRGGGVETVFRAGIRGSDGGGHRVCIRDLQGVVFPLL